MAEKYRIREIGVFGSYVRGIPKKKSDVDILAVLSYSADVISHEELIAS